MSKVITLEGLAEYNKYLPFKKEGNNIIPMNETLENKFAGYNNNIFLSMPIDEEDYDTANAIVIGDNNSLNGNSYSEISAGTVIIGRDTKASNDHQVLLGNHNNETLSESVLFSCGSQNGSVLAVTEGDFLNERYKEYEDRSYLYDNSGLSLVLGNTASIYTNSNSIVFQPKKSEQYDSVPYFMFQQKELNKKTDQYGYATIDLNKSMTDAYAAKIKMENFVGQDSLNVLFTQYEKDNKYFLCVRQTKNEAVMKQILFSTTATTNVSIKNILISNGRFNTVINRDAYAITYHQLNTTDDTISSEGYTFPKNMNVYGLLKKELDVNMITYCVSMNDYEVASRETELIQELISNYPPSFSTDGDGASNFWVLMPYLNNEQYESYWNEPLSSDIVATALTFNMGMAGHLASAPWMQ